ncbi:MAG TPA: hypothetical protein VII99_13730 [Bacteroidia bacterium]
MEREQLKKEIRELAEKIKAGDAADAEALLSDVAQLYEKAVLLRHFPEEIKKAETDEKTEEKKNKAEEKRPAPADLFSMEDMSVAAQSETPPAPKSEEKKKPEESVAEKLSHKKIGDLKSFIGINEKFRFINELFDGNMKEYTVAVDQINSFISFEEAEPYLADIKEMYKWSDENAIAANFIELVKRRFS